MEESSGLRVKGGRLPVAFEDRGHGAKLAAVGGPLVLGALSGVLIGVSAGVYWGLQVLAATGGLLAGLEHQGAAAGARRGLVGGALYGAALLLAHAATGLHEHVSLGDTPALLVVITGVFGCGFGAVGGHLRARAEA